MRTFKLTIDEEELKALINHHHYSDDGRYSIDKSSRIHELTKRLNKRVDDNNNDVEERPVDKTDQPKIEGWG